MGKVIYFIDFFLFIYIRKKGLYIICYIILFLQYLYEVVYRFRLQIENVLYDVDIVNYMML